MYRMFCGDLGKCGERVDRERAARGMESHALSGQDLADLVLTAVTLRKKRF